MFFVDETFSISKRRCNYHPYSGNHENGVDTGLQRETLGREEQPRGCSVSGVS